MDALLKIVEVFVSYPPVTLLVAALLFGGLVFMGIGFNGQTVGKPRDSLSKTRTAAFTLVGMGFCVLAVGFVYVIALYYSPSTPSREGAIEGDPPPAPPWKAHYFDNPNFQGAATVQREDPFLSFDWGNGQPIPAGAIPADHFSVRWERCSDFEGGTYTFKTMVDDNIEVWVDGTLELNASAMRPDEGGRKLVEREVNVSAGERCLKVEFREHEGGAFVFFDYEKN